MGTEPHLSLLDLASDSGPLSRITGSVCAKDRLRSLDLEFAAGMLCLRCDDDTDEIVVEVARRESDRPSVAHPALADLAGMSIESTWVMTNHRGYVDAFQLRLRDESGREETRQFEVAASAMDVRRVIA